MGVRSGRPIAGSQVSTEKLQQARRTGLGVGIAVACTGASVIPRWTPLGLAQGLAFLAAGIVLVGALLGSRSRIARRLLPIGGVLVLFLAAWNVRNAAPFAMYFGLIGATFVLLDRPSDRYPHIAEWLAFAAFWIGGLAFTGYLLKVPEIRQPGSPFSMALAGALAMVALPIGIICARPERGIAAIAVSSTSAGMMLRRLVPETLLLPPIGMWFLVELLPRLQLIDMRLGATVATLLVSTVVALLEMRQALKLAATDSDRQAHQASLRRALADLASALSERDRVQKDLERSNRDLDEFAYAASHDLRAPLRGIANLAHWLEEDLGSNLPASAQKQLDLLRSRVHRMEALIDGILKYSRAGRTHEPPQLVAVDELVRETLELIAPPPSAQIHIEGKLPELLTERAQLQQVFLNLIGNAIKHAHRSDPQVEIRAEDLGEQVRFTISDNGPGIAPQYQERIFGMFQTLETRDQVEGTGIGLATVKKLVERRGGQVGVESAEGHGARFFFVWPRQHNA